MLPFWHGLCDVDVAAIELRKLRPCAVCARHNGEHCLITARPVCGELWRAVCEGCLAAFQSTLPQLAGACFCALVLLHVGFHLDVLWSYCCKLRQVDRVAQVSELSIEIRNATGTRVLLVCPHEVWSRSVRRASCRKRQAPA